MIVKQPNGKYAEWSNVVDAFTVLDADEAEIVADRVFTATRDAIRDVREKIAQLEAGEKPYHQFTMTWEQCLEHMKEVHGPEHSWVVGAIKAGVKEG